MLCPATAPGSGTITARDGIRNPWMCRINRMGRHLRTGWSTASAPIWPASCTSIQRLTASDRRQAAASRCALCRHAARRLVDLAAQFVVSPDGVPETYDFRARRCRRPCRTGRGSPSARWRMAAALLGRYTECFAEVHRAAGHRPRRDGGKTEGSIPARGRARFRGPAGRVRLGLIGGASRHKGFGPAGAPRSNAQPVRYHRPYVSGRGSMALPRVADPARDLETERR